MLSAPAAPRPEGAPTSTPAAAKKPDTTKDGFGVSKDGLAEIVLEKDTNVLGRYGGRNGVLRKLRADQEHGLRTEVVAHHRAVFGANKLPEKTLKPFWLHLLEALNDVVLIALMIASIVTIAFGAAVTKDFADYIEGVAIMLAVIVVSGVGSVQNYSQEKQFNSLAKIKADRPVLVLRDGVEKQISVHDVVVGDVFILRPGEVLPCDGLLLTGSGIKCDESAMTGETADVPKNLAESPFLVGGSNVVSGAGTMLVLTTGLDTTYGQIVKALEDQEPPPTPLQDKLEALATRIGYVGLGGGVLIFLILTITFLVRFFPLYPDAFKSILSFFVIGVTIIVVAVPEGLPLAVTLTLVYSMKQMIKDHVLVRELQACETMGSATCICSDKTGTLTENRMTVMRGWFFGALYEEGVPLLEQLGGTVRRDLLARSIALNSDTQVRYTTEEGAEKVEVLGNKTEGALLHMLKKGYDLDYLYVRKSGGPPIFRENFDSSRKRMTSIYAPASPAGSVGQLKTIEEGGTLEVAGVPTGFPGCGKFTVYTKGASEMVVALCSRYMAADGTAVPIDGIARRELHGMIESMASKGLRTLAIAVRHIDPTDAPEGGLLAGETGSRAWEGAIVDGSIESEMTLIAIAGIQDPVRVGVPEAVAKCKSAGIKVRMVTGDNVSTARSIAEECGIYNGGTVLEGKAWREMTPEQRKDVLPSLEILARAVPSDKLILVETLKELGETVAVTGDGTNDAPSLKAAHVGCAMGIAGTEVAKDACKMIIMDDNFASVVLAVLWGRSVIENIRKFLVYQLTINLVAGLLTFIMACYYQGEVKQFPLEAIQLLWINLLMDSFAALMLATEPPDPELMRMKPQDQNAPLMTRTMFKYVAVTASYQLAMMLWMTLTTAGTSLFLLTPLELGSRQHYTCIFNTFVWMQIFNLFNARRIHDQWDLLRNFSKSRMAHVMLTIIVVLQVIFVELGGDGFRTSSLSAGQWGICLALGLTSFPIGWICRLIPWRDGIFNAPAVGSAGGLGAGGGLAGQSAANPYQPYSVVVDEGPEAAAQLTSRKPPAAVPMGTAASAAFSSLRASSRPSITGGGGGVGTITATVGGGAGAGGGGSTTGGFFGGGLSSRREASSASVHPILLEQEGGERDTLVTQLPPSR